jgi:hypothetical protein
MMSAIQTTNKWFLVGLAAARPKCCGAPQRDDTDNEKVGSKKEELEVPEPQGFGRFLILKSTS